MLARTSALFKALFGWSVAQTPLRETAWLDGVRGTAAFLVMMNHFNMEWMTPFSDAPFGATAVGDRNPDGVYFHKDGDRFWAPWRLLLLRVLMTSGSAQVAVFFVLSGLVLSWSPLQSIHARNTDKLFQSLASSVVRRWFRLFLPCIIVGLFYCARRIYNDYHGLLGAFQELWHYIVATERWANPLETSHTTQFSTNNEYAFVMWTIPFEYGGSLFVYVSLIGLSRMRNTLYRVVIILLVAHYALYKLLWGFWLFGLGIALSDYVQAMGGFQKLSQSTSTISCCLWYLVFVLSLLTMGWAAPNEWYTTPGYSWTAVLPIPDGYRGFVGEERFWYGWAGIMLLTSASHLRLIQRFYELPFVQYLGRISFMLYLIHYLINLIVALPIRLAIYESLCTKEFDELFDGDVYRTTSAFNIGTHIALWLICIPLVLITASFLERWVDRTCTDFAKWLDAKLTGGAPRKPDKAVSDEEQHQLLHPDELELGRMSSDSETLELGAMSSHLEASSSSR